VFLLVKNVKNILRTSKISYNRNPVNRKLRSREARRSILYILYTSRRTRAQHEKTSATRYWCVSKVVDLINTYIIYKNSIRACRKLILYAAKCVLTAFMLWPSYNGHLLGSFFKGAFLPQNGTYCPLLATIQPFSKARVFLYT
jgi:hypothetical protein